MTVITVITTDHNILFVAGVARTVYSVKVETHRNNAASWRHTGRGYLVVKASASGATPSGCTTGGRSDEAGSWAAS